MAAPGKAVLRRPRHDLSINTEPPKKKKEPTATPLAAGGDTL